jgi:hypothetical protein
MKEKSKNIAKIERDNITLTLTADNGSQSVKNYQKRRNCKFSSGEAFWFGLNLA